MWLMDPCWKTFIAIASLIAKEKLNKLMRVLSLFHREGSSDVLKFKKSLRCWFGSLDRSPGNEHPFCTNRMVSDRREHSSNENYDSESDKEEPKFEKITINTDYKIKTSLEEPPTDLELKPLPDNLEYVFLEEPSFLPIIISSQLSAQNKSKLVSVLKKHKEAFAWKTTDIPGICPSFCKHKIQLLDDKKPVVQKQRRLNPNMQEVVKKEIVKLLDTSIIYLIADRPWVSPIHVVPKRKLVLLLGIRKSWSFH
ncbi:hypothetical protein Tco_1081020 [Tanacetum coccineum]|uniref:Reverse transcriptase domain-containing protein n=1 Tax=Tanacetum coccineum TaxID=301880 RepID=A0ABQ5HXW7_9ASTR